MLWLTRTKCSGRRIDSAGGDPRAPLQRRPTDQAGKQCLSDNRMPTGGSSLLRDSAFGALRVCGPEYTQMVSSIQPRYRRRTRRIDLMKEDPMATRHSNHMRPTAADTAGIDFNPMGRSWPGLILGAVLFLIFVGALDEPSPAPHIALASLCLLAGVGIAATAHFMIKDDREIKQSGRLYRFIEDYVTRVRDFIVDNPEIGEDDRVRRELLPSEAELEVVAFHPSFKKMLREVREGTSVLLLRSTVHSGVPLRLTGLCLKPRGHDDFLVEIETPPTPVVSRALPPRSRRPALLPCPPSATPTLDTRVPPPSVEG